MLVKTGMRRAELVALNRSDIKIMDGHHVAVIEHGKGDKRRIVKLRVDVYRALDEYLQARGQEGEALFPALFVMPATKRRLPEVLASRLLCGSLV